MATYKEKITLAAFHAEQMDYGLADLRKEAEAVKGGAKEAIQVHLDAARKAVKLVRVMLCGIRDGKAARVSAAPRPRIRAEVYGNDRTRGVVRMIDHYPSQQERLAMLAEFAGRHGIHLPSPDGSVEKCLQEATDAIGRVQGIVCYEAYPAEEAEP